MFAVNEHEFSARFTEKGKDIFSLLDSSHQHQVKQTEASFDQ